MIKKIKRIVIPMITTVLIAGSCMVVSAGTERDSITSGGLTMEYSVTTKSPTNVPIIVVITEIKNG